MIRNSRRTIYCCGCLTYVDARCTSGEEIYPHRTDLHHKLFLRCDGCGNYVGCHPDQGYAPLGVIATPELRNARGHIHALLDPIWRSGKIRRRKLYKKVSKALGIDEFHTANIRSLEEARHVYRAIRGIRLEFETGCKK